MVDWNRELSRELALDGGGCLFTLSDAADLLHRRCEGTTDTDQIAFASALLQKAAETGKWPDLQAATEQTALVLCEGRPA